MPRTVSVVVFMLGLNAAVCADAQPPIASPSAPPAATIEQTQQAVDRALAYLQLESAAWWNTRKCAACHHLPLPLWALSEADRKGYKVDQEYVQKTFEALLGSPDRLMASRIFPNPADPPDPRPQGRGLNMGLPFLTVAAQSFPSETDGRQQSLLLIRDEILKKQQPNGSWEFFSSLRRPPINESQTTDGAWIIMALESQIRPESPESEQKALARAVEWLDTARPSDSHQDKVLKVMWEVRHADRQASMQATIDELLTLQRADGGWSQTVPEPKSDAFATGQTLYALSLAGMTTEKPEFQRGIDFLVATQGPEGSWPMTSRSTPDGSPGSATLLSPITCAATSWATLGLVHGVPRKKLGDCPRYHAPLASVRCSRPRDRALPTRPWLNRWTNVRCPLQLKKTAERCRFLIPTRPLANSKKVFSSGFGESRVPF